MKNKHIGKILMVSRHGLMLTLGKGSTRVVESLLSCLAARETSCMLECCKYMPTRQCRPADLPACLRCAARAVELRHNRQERGVRALGVLCRHPGACVLHHAEAAQPAVCAH